jgi:peptidoglycan/xylan/chitin deacetylase (PgdA/CDA1 family)
MVDQPLKIAFLVGSDSRSVNLSIETVCALPNVKPVAVFLDRERAGLRRRVRNLVRNVRRNGWRYIPHRFFEALRERTDAWVSKAAAPPSEVQALLRKAFPDRCWTLQDLALKYEFALYVTGNLNGTEVVERLRACGADLGIVLGTRVLKPATFGAFPLGCANLHKGKVPEYRGMPPGFWELYEGAPTAGVTVHFINAGLDTGDIVATGEIPILKTDTPLSLLEKLHAAGAKALGEAISAIQSATASRRAQEESREPARTLPTLRQVAELRRKLPHWKGEGPLYTVLKNLYCLFVYYSGLYSLMRLLHRAQKSRGAIFLYHRINDVSKDPLTVDTETFASHLLALSRKYEVSSTSALVDCLRNSRTLRPTSVAIHFDDCYRDVLLHGAPLLQAAGVPATAFINSGFIDTNRTFDHDSRKYPFTFEMLRSDEVREWARRGFEVGAHTVNHVDLGKCPRETARDEIVDCGRRLQELTGRTVNLFSFPFGGVANITSDAIEDIQSAGYIALFSAHGGFLKEDTSVYDIPRMGISYEASALYALLQVEGIAPSQIGEALRGRG